MPRNSDTCSENGLFTPRVCFEIGVVPRFLTDRMSFTLSSLSPQNAPGCATISPLVLERFTLRHMEGGAKGLRQEGDDKKSGKGLGSDQD